MTGTRATPEQRILRRIEINPETDCWEFQGSRNVHGYGRITVGGHVVYTHRVMYEAHRGPIPAGLHLDHLCRNEPCCNPEHLEPVTPTENKLRGQAPAILLHHAGVCARGHSLAEHAYYRKNGRVVYCRVCRQDRDHAAK